MATVQEIKQALPIEAVVAEYVPTLRRAGATYKANCPFHSDKTPSFVVSPDRQTFKCFGCGAAGDVIEFVRRIENLEFKDAVRLLAEKASLAVDFDPAPTVDPESEAIYAINAAATLYFQSGLRGTAGAGALAYLRERGLADETLDRFALGYAPDGWDHLLRYLGQRAYAPEALVSAGLATKRDDGGQYDRFRNRIIFPIRDTKGRVLGFGGRSVGTAQPKYLNSPQTRVFDKGSVFYCQDVAAEHIRKSGRVVIVEGYMDALVAHQAGFRDVVASMGTSLTEKQVRTLNKSGRTVVLALDPDAAGFRAVERTIQLAYRTAERELSPALTTRAPTERSAGRFTGSARVRFQVVAVPDGKDPDELILEDPDAWRRLIDGALPIVDFYVKQVSSSLSDSLEFKRDAAARIVPILAELGDPLERDHYVAELARMLEVSEQTVAGLVAQQRQSSGSWAHPATTSRPEMAPEGDDAPQAARPVPKRLDALSTVERRALSLLIRYPHVVPSAGERLRAQAFRDARLAGLAGALLALEPTPLDTTDLLAALEPASRTLAAEVLLDTASLPHLDDDPLARDLDSLFHKWNELAIRDRLVTHERAFQSAPAEQVPDLSEAVQTLTREMREVFTQAKPG